MPEYVTNILSLVEKQKEFFNQLSEFYRQLSRITELLDLFLFIGYG